MKQEIKKAKTTQRLILRVAENIKSDCSEIDPSLKPLIKSMRQEIKKVKTTQRFILRVAGNIEPELIGPFKTAKSRDLKARRLNNATENDGIFWLNITDGKVNVGAYSGGFMDGLDWFGGSEKWK